MAKPINWDLVTSLMIRYYPKEYQRILAEQQTRMDLSSIDPPKEGAKRRAARSNRHASKQQTDDHAQ